MRWKLTLMLVATTAISACSSQSAETAENFGAAPTDVETSAVESPAPPPAPFEPAPAESKPAASPGRRAPAPTRSAPTAAAISKDVPSPAPPPAPKKPAPVIIPSGTELNIVLSDALNSGKNKPGDEFTASLAAPVYVNGVAILERGDSVKGAVVDAQGSGRVSGKATMTLALTGVMHDGEMIPISTKSLATEAESSTGRDAGVIGGGAGVGAIIGAIAGGKKGAATGAAIGGAAGTGTVLATKGKEVDFPAESKLSFVLDGDLSVIP